METLRLGIERWYPNLRFMTLTAVGEFKKSFSKLKRFLKKNDIMKEYFAVRTGEGSGVIHLVYTGKSVKYGDLKAEWKRITGAWNVSISKVRNVPGLIREMCYQHRVIRYFHSEFWVKPRKTNQMDLADNILQEYYRESDMRFHA